MSKFTVMFKMPDAGTDAINIAIEDGTILTEKDKRQARAVVDKFVAHDEYVYIEIDTVKKTATVLPASED